MAEILRAEGLNCFEMADLSAVNGSTLSKFKLVLLTAGPLTTSQADMIENYVVNGGDLVAMRPTGRLDGVCGLEPVTGETNDSYIQVTDLPIGGGIARETLQFHGSAQHYRPAGAQVVAWLSSQTTHTDFPAVTLHRYGQGRAAAWAFDLARSVAYTRQGNPAWANQERDGFWLIRPTDMFKGWVDLDRLAIPQADEQQRLLVNLLTDLSQYPLPRLWYFPDNALGMFVATSDAHQNSALAVERILGLVEAHGGCMSVYYLPPQYSYLRRLAQKGRWLATVLSPTDPAYLPSPAQIANWRARGHEFGLHPEISTAGLEVSWQAYWEAFTGLGYGPVPPTTRTHAIVWTGWVETARLQAVYGLRMNLDYYHVGPSLRTEAGEWVFGHFTGSGLPMKFVDEQGRILNIYQQLTQLADDHLLKLHWGSQANFSAAEAVAVSEDLLRRSVSGGYSAITAIFHTDPFDEGEPWAAEETAWLNGTLDFASRQGIPIWSAQEWLRFTEVRHEANLSTFNWQSGRLSFNFETEPAADVGLGLLLPWQQGQTTLKQVEVDGQVVEHNERKVSGVKYGWISIAAGRHQIEVKYA